MNKKEMLSKIEKLVTKGKKDTLFILLGHLPLDYFNETISETKWGNFSMTTFKLGLEVAKRFQGKKKIQFFFLVDDKGTVEEIQNLNSTQMKRIRKKVYKNADRFFRELFQDELMQAGFSDEDVVLQQSDKAWRNELKLHSELLLFRDSNITNVCAGSYQQIVKQYGENAILLSFIPTLCKENICMTAMSMLDFHPDYELINCFMEVGKKTEEELLNSCILRSSLERK